MSEPSSVSRLFRVYRLCGEIGRDGDEAAAGAATLLNTVAKILAVADQLAHVGVTLANRLAVERCHVQYEQLQVGWNLVSCHSLPPI